MLFCIELSCVAEQPEPDYVRDAVGPKIIKRTVGKNLLAGLVYTDASQFHVCLMVLVVCCFCSVSCSVLVIISCSLVGLKHRPGSIKFDIPNVTESALHEFLGVFLCVCI